MESSGFESRAKRVQAFSAFAKSDFATAYRLGSEVLKELVRDQALCGMLGIAASKIGRTRDAEKHLKRALKLQPKRVDLHFAMADVHTLEGRFDEAIESFDRGLKHAPHATIGLAGKASVLERRGDRQAAADLIKPLIDSSREDAFTASIFAKIEQSEGNFAQTIDLIAKHLGRPQTDFPTRKTLCELIAKAYEKTGDYAKAFEAFKLSNDLIARPFDPKEFIEEIDTLIGVFSEQNLAMLPRAANRSELPVFVASMPRSGSTLCEQIVHAHSKAVGAGEITEIAQLIRELPDRLESFQPYPLCLGDFTHSHASTLGRWYVEHLRRQAPGAARIVNKHLENWRHLGMISLVCPGARVIHATRDPMDNCFSVFMAAMNTEIYPWSTSLEHIGLVYRQYERVMDHWCDVLDLPILEVPYERLVADTETWIRRIIEFAGLDWEDQCLRYYEAGRDVHTLSYDQVRRPIYTSAVKRYEKYFDHLAPLRAALDSN